MSYFDPKEFYFKTPIYNKVTITSENFDDFQRLVSFNGRIDFYHPTLKENTTYTVHPCRHNNVNYFLKYGGWEYSVVICLRTNEEYFFFYYYEIKEGDNVDDERIHTFQKIGQIPSIADFHIDQVKKYTKVLDKERLKEFTRAIGLAANGVGIGSFVYLRRIFEVLLEEAHSQAKTKKDWDEEAYVKQRVVERIEILKQYLPEFLVENKSLYGIVSKGIHSLTEKECLGLFETVKIGIELILDERLEKFEKQKKLEDAKRNISDITRTLKKS
jgi:hypothetical protein